MQCRYQSEEPGADSQILSFCVWQENLSAFKFQISVLQISVLELEPALL